VYGICMACVRCVYGICTSMVFVWYLYDTCPMFAFDISSGYTDCKSSCFAKTHVFYSTNTDHPFFHKMGPEQRSRLGNWTKLVPAAFRVVSVSWKSRNTINILQNSVKYDAEHTYSWNFKDFMLCLVLRLDF